ncbi:MAG: SDR family oxidoreductase [Armatimonadetes bacterium]|nr:SDR family oxidoreductase [Armatimonadota bacterium]
MDFGISGRVAMVAAASKGIGLAVAKELAQEGCRVSICARNQEALGAACEAIGGARGYLCDVSRAEDLERWYEGTKAELGTPEILVTNTGGPPAGAPSETSDDEWQAGFDSTLMNVVRLVRLASPGMIERGWGRFVHLTSLFAKEPSSLLAISSTLRSGLMALTRLQATELAPKGITVNAVLPGHTLTDRQVHLAEIRAGLLGVTAEEALKLQAEAAPVMRLGNPDEIAAAVAFLCSDRAGFITGANLLVDGGIVKGLG